MRRVENGAPLNFTRCIMLPITLLCIVNHSRISLADYLEPSRREEYVNDLLQRQIVVRDEIPEVRRYAAIRVRLEKQN
jgi:hypothetical protein